jgi:hypothetical protein
LPDGLSGNLPVVVFCRGSDRKIALAREAKRFALCNFSLKESPAGGAAAAIADEITKLR